MILKNIKKDLFWTSWATPNINESNLKLNKQLFWEDSLIQNYPNFPDLAYHIETLWGKIKSLIKRKAPKSLNNLKRYTLEEWNSIKKIKFEKMK